MTETISKLYFPHKEEVSKIGMQGKKLKQKLEEWKKKRA